MKSQTKGGNKFVIVTNFLTGKGKLPGLVVNVEDSQSEPWSLGVSSIPGFA